MWVGADCLVEVVDCAADTDSEGSSSVITLWSINMLMHTLPHQTIAFLAPYVISTYRFLTSTKTYKFTLLVPSLPFTNTNTMPRLFFFFFFAHILRSNRAESQRGFAAEGKSHTFHLQFSLAGYRQGFDLLPWNIRYKLHVAAWEGVASNRHTHTHIAKLHNTSKKICLSHRFV